MGDIAEQIMTQQCFGIEFEKKGSTATCLPDSGKAQNYAVSTFVEALFPQPIWLVRWGPCPDSSPWRSPIARLWPVLEVLPT